MNNEVLFLVALALILAWIGLRLIALGIDMILSRTRSREQQRTGGNKSSAKTTR
jgi:uncharacterized membrane protein